MTQALRIVHVSATDNEGGSGRSAYRVHQGLRRRGHVSRMLVGQKVTEDADVDLVYGGRLGRVADRIADEATRRLGLQYFYLPSSRRLRAHPWLQDPSIIQLYNLHGGYFSHRILPWLSHRAPIVWRLSDAWPLTGHCVYPGECTRWSSGCGGCPDLQSYPSVPFDTTALLWRTKQSLYARCRITLVAPSRWTERLARESPLFPHAEVHRIPNGLDTDVFRPMDRAAARHILNLPVDRKIVLFSAAVVAENPRKGSGQLIAALQMLAARTDVAVMLMGLGGEQWKGRIPQDVIALGVVRDDRMIGAAYAAADVVAVPSAEDNLPNSLLEAMACGRAVVANDVGGIRDAVQPGENGLLVAPNDPSQFARALTDVLDNSDLRDRLGAAARHVVVKEFSADLQAQRFEDLYRHVLSS